MCLPQGSAAASAGSIAVTSANASHGSNKRAREDDDQSSVPKRARANPATLPLPLPFAPAPPVPKVTKSNKLSAKEVPIFGYRSVQQQLQEAAAALIAIAKQARNINKRPTIFIDLPGGKRRRMPSQAISSSNGNGGPRPNSNRRIIINAPIFGRRPAPTTAPSDTDFLYLSSDSDSDDRMNNQSHDDTLMEYSSDSEDESSFAGINNVMSAVAIQSTFRGHCIRDMKPRAMPQTELLELNVHDGQQWDDAVSDDDLLGIEAKPQVEEEDDKGKAIAASALLELRAMPQAEQELDGHDSQEWSFAAEMAEEEDNADDESSSNGTIESNDGDVDDESSIADDSGASLQSEEVHFEATNNAVEADGDDDVATAKSASTAEEESYSQPRFEFDTAAMDATAMDIDNDGQDSVNLDAASNASESNSTEAIEEEEEDAVDEEEEEVEVVQPAPRRRSRMLTGLQSTLDGRYWTKPTTRREIFRD